MQLPRFGSAHTGFGWDCAVPYGTRVLALAPCREGMRVTGQIPKGTLCAAGLEATNKHPHVWPNPDEFDPGADCSALMLTPLRVAEAQLRSLWHDFPLAAITSLGVCSRSKRSHACAAMWALREYRHSE